MYMVCSCQVEVVREREREREREIKTTEPFFAWAVLFCRKSLGSVDSDEGLTRQNTEIYHSTSVSHASPDLLMKNRFLQRVLQVCDTIFRRNFCSSGWLTIIYWCRDPISSYFEPTRDSRLSSTSITLVVGQQLWVSVSSFISCPSHRENVFIYILCVSWFSPPPKTPAHLTLHITKRKRLLHDSYFQLLSHFHLTFIS